MVTASSEYLTGQPSSLEVRIFGNISRLDVLERLSRYCQERFGAALKRQLFYRVGSGLVIGLTLVTGLSLVLKLTERRRGAGFLAECEAIRAHLAARGYPAGETLFAPEPFESGFITALSFVEAGPRVDPHQPKIRAAIARALANWIGLAASYEHPQHLGAAWFTSVPADKLWPRPHDPSLVFSRAASAAEIDRIAQRALEARSRLAGQKVIAHFDWRLEHLRFDSSEHIATLAFDWDSLHFELEPVAVGAAAHAFSWDERGPDPVPRVDELEAFLEDYQQARGRSFTEEERATALASLLYSLAYSARCNHTLSSERPLARGDFRRLLFEAADRFL
jgi:hypothetical protein